MNAVELDQVTKAFGPTVAVDGLSLAVPRESIYGFIGPNGSGKTTTLRMILSILYPDRGTVRLLGEAVRGGRNPRVGYLPEERGLYKAMKVRQILRFYGELKTGRKVDAAVEEWLTRLNLQEYAGKKVEALSKGTSQRVQFAAAIVGQPEVVILDEPFSGLDPVNAEVIREAVLELRGRGTTIILSTHDMNVAERMCDFILMIFRGRKVLDGTLASIQAQYAVDTIRVRLAGPPSALAALPGVVLVRDFGQVQELRLTAGTDPQAVMLTLLQRTRVESFEVARPSLQDIFVRIAGPGEKGGLDA